MRKREKRETVNEEERCRKVGGSERGMEGWREGHRGREGRRERRETERKGERHQ